MKSHTTGTSSETQPLTAGNTGSFRSTESSANTLSPNTSSSSPSPPSPHVQCKRVIINMGGGKTKQGHRCTMDCLERYPIHHAARMGKFKILQKLLHKISNAENITPPVKMCNPLEKDECFGRTPLHYAAVSGNVEKGLLCTKLLLECSALTVEAEKRTEKLRKFVNATDYNNDTALHLAANNEATKIVRELVLNQADLDIVGSSGRSALMEVYKKTPLAMNEALHQSISYVELCKRDVVQEEEDNNSKRKSSSHSDEIDYTRSYIDVCLNFYPLLGSDVSKGRGKCEKPLPETTFLYKINRKRMESDVRRQILNNVLVQSFLYFKWNKIKLFCFFAIFLHVVWLALYIGIVIDVFVVNCPYQIPTVVETSSNDTNETVLDNHQDASVCRVNTAVSLASVALLVVSVGITVKELFQFIRLKSLYIRFENFGQCTLLTFIFITTPSIYLCQETVIDPLHYQLSAFGIFLAWTLFLCQLAKLPRLCLRVSIFGMRGCIILPDHGLYVEILTRVFKNFLIFITIFSSLLISFVFSFNILLPNSTGFINLSNSILKVLTMMTGELNYDEIFHSEDEKVIYPVSSHVMYAIFIMVATIILFNLLIGFTVSDIQGLQKDAEVNQISNKLEQIFLMECFLLSTPMQLVLRLYGKIVRGAGSQSDVLQRIMVTRRTLKSTWLCYHTKIKGLPKEHRVEIRDWAARNCLIMADVRGVTRPNLFQNFSHVFQT